MKNKILAFLPFGYFIKTRVPTIDAFVFHLYYEWIPAIIFLFLFSSTFFDSIVHFLLYYFIFINFYELGYLLNDFHSVKFEESPRLRSDDPIKSLIPYMIILRLMLFVGLVVQNELLERWEFILFYVFLGVVFFLHNIIRKKEYKLATFINLAFLRYIAPFVFLVESKNLLVIIPSIFLNYVFYRSISYLESKNLVVFPERKGGMFKLSYYSLILPCSLLLSVFVGNYLPLFINLYYLFFWVLFWIKNNLVKSGKV